MTTRLTHGQIFFHLCCTRYMFFVKLLASFLLSIEVREQAQTMWIAMGEGGSCNVHFTNKAYLVKLFTKGEAEGHYAMKPSVILKQKNPKFLNLPS